MKATFRLIGRHWIALAILAVALIIHFWLIVVHPASVLYGGPGDHTASLIWLYEKSPETPWWGYTSVSAFPFGENLWSPTYLLGQLLYILFWVCSSLFSNGVVGYNILTTCGFVLSFIAFYVASRRLFSINKIFSSIGAYVVSFTPFILSLNEVGHLSYVFAPAASIIVYWLFASTFDNNKKWLLRASILGFIVGFSWIFDPYFLLFLFLLIVSLSVAYLVCGQFKKKQLGTVIHKFVVIGIGLVIGVVPLAIYSHIQSKNISDSTSYRASIQNDAQQYSAQLKDYVLPSKDNPVLPRAFTEAKKTSLHSSAAPLYVGSTILLLLLVSVLWHIKNRRSIPRIAIICFVATLFMIVFSLPPKIHLLGIEVLTPTQLIIDLSNAWRVFARIFVFLYPVFILGVLLLANKVWHEGEKLTKIIVILLCVMLPFDMLVRNPLNINKFWDINKSIPATYTEAHVTSKDVIAEYPLREAPHYKGSLYFSAQLSHQASIINPMMPDTSKLQENFRRSIADLYNPQTIGALKFLGVTKIQTWTDETVATSTPPGTTLRNETIYSGLFGPQKVSSYTINENVRPLRYIVENTQAQRLWGDEIKDIKDVVDTQTSLTIVDICTLKNLPLCSQNSQLLNPSITASIENNSNNSAEVSIENEDGSNKQSILLELKGTSTMLVDANKVNIRTPLPISISNYHIVKNVN